jgi:very-short-patch-repair endonuclease
MSSTQAPFRSTNRVTPRIGVKLEPVYDLASRQHGAISNRQLRRIGVSARVQRTLLAAHRIEVAAPGVVVVAGSAETWHRQLSVGLLALGPRAFVSHESAAALLGLDRRQNDVVAFTIPRGGRIVEVRGATVHTTTRVGPIDVISVGGFRCTSATRTVLDLAADGATSDRLAGAIDSAIRLRLSAPLVLLERLSGLRGPGRHGVRLLDQLLLDSGGESMLERRFLKLVREAGLPRPKTQRRIRSGERHVARVDFIYDDLRMVIEVTGRLGHSSPADRGRDAQRRNELQDLGYVVYEYTWADVTRRPAYVVSTLESRRRTRAASLM